MTSAAARAALDQLEAAVAALDTPRGFVDGLERSIAVTEAAGRLAPDHRAEAAQAVLVFEGLRQLVRAIHREEIG